jgi:rRNA maturation endonuclease Nob1
MEGMDLRKYQKEGEEKDKIKDIMGKILSGRSGYQTVIDDTKPIPKCECGKILEGEEKFCPECGKKLQ